MGTHTHTRIYANLKLKHHLNKPTAVPKKVSVIWQCITLLLFYSSPHHPVRTLTIPSGSDDNG